MPTLDRWCRWMLGMAAASAACGSAFGQVELRLGWRVAAATRDAPVPPQPTLAWSTVPALPGGAGVDLAELKAAVDASPIPHKALLLSEDGKAVALFHRHPWHGDTDPAPALGVTVWPDWRAADTVVSFPDMGDAEFLSNHHVLLSHHPHGGPYLSFVVDLRQAGTRFQFSGYRLDTLRVTDLGRWATLTMDGQLCTGRFDAAAAATSVVGTPVPTGGVIRNLAWVADGRFLLVERTGALLEVLDPETGRVVSSLPGGLGPSAGVVNSVGDGAYEFAQPGVGAAVVEAKPDGTLVAIRWPHQLAGESTVSASPSRRFVITQKQTLLGFVPRFCRRTPLATAADEPPEWPTVPRGTAIQDIGWLRWSAPEVETAPRAVPDAGATPQR